MQRGCSVTNTHKSTRFTGTKLSVLLRKLQNKDDNIDADAIEKFCNSIMKDILSDEKMHLIKV